MPNFEQHTVVGHVGGEPTQRYTSEGVAVTSFSLAVNDPRKKDAPPTWYRVTCWRATAEFAMQYVKKGAAVLVDGDRLALSEWTAQDGGARTTLELTARRIELLTRADGNGAQESGEASDMPF